MISLSSRVRIKKNLDNKKKENEGTRKITVGDHQIQESKSTKLLTKFKGNDQIWKSHFCGKGGLLSALNQRLFMVKRMSNHISNKTGNSQILLQQQKAISCLMLH